MEDNNTYIGASSDGATGITNATALGYQAKITQSNSLVLGSINGVNGSTADTTVGIGKTSPTERLTLNRQVLPARTAQQDPPVQPGPKVPPAQAPLRR